MAQPSAGDAPVLDKSMATRRLIKFLDIIAIGNVWLSERFRLKDPPNTLSGWHCFRLVVNNLLVAVAVDLPQCLDQHQGK